MVCEHHEALQERLGHGKEIMDRHEQKLDKIFGLMITMLVSIIAGFIGVAGTVWVASGKPDPAIARIERIVEMRMAEHLNRYITGIPDGTTLYDFIKEDGWRNTNSGKDPGKN